MAIVYVAAYCVRSAASPSGCTLATILGKLVRASRFSAARDARTLIDIGTNGVGAATFPAVGTVARK